jgi:hypothetical protein
VAFHNAKNTRQARRGLIPNYCEIPDCTFTALVTKHRIKPGRRGGKYIAGNVIGLCPNCHVLAEQGHYSQFELFQIVQKRLREENLRSREEAYGGLDLATG